MKTAEEWAETYQPYRVVFAHVRYHPVTEAEIKQIQLDAIKEGMRRAADTLTIHYRKIYPTVITNQELRQVDAILSAAEQLTIKDL